MRNRSNKPALQLLAAAANWTLLPRLPSPLPHLLVEPASSAHPCAQQRQRDARGGEERDGAAGAGDRPHLRRQRPRHRLGVLADEVEGLLVLQGGATGEDAQEGGGGQGEETPER